MGRGPAGRSVGEDRPHGFGLGQPERPVQAISDLGLGRDAHEMVERGRELRGRDRVGLEVDADSPTGADGLYTSMGWTPDYVTESWFRELTVDDDGSGA